MKKICSIVTAIIFLLNTVCVMAAGSASITDSYYKKLGEGDRAVAIAREGGWYHTSSAGDDRKYSITGYGDSMRFNADSCTFDDWAKLGMDFAEAGVSASALQGDVYVGFEGQMLMFHKNQYGEESSRPYAYSYRVTDDKGGIISKLEIICNTDLTFDVSVIALNGEQNATVRFDSPVESHLPNWSGDPLWVKEVPLKIETFVDTETSSYTIRVNDKWIEPEDGKCFYIGSGVVGEDSLREIQGVGGVEFMMDEMFGDSSFLIDVIRAGKSEADSIVIDDVKVTSDQFFPDTIYQGSRVNAEVITDGEELSGSKFEWEYSVDGSTWNVFEDVVPDRAIKIRLNATCYGAFGAVDTWSGEFDVEEALPELKAESLTVTTDTPLNNTIVREGSNITVQAVFSGAEMAGEPVISYTYTKDKAEPRRWSTFKRAVPKGAAAISVKAEATDIYNRKTVIAKEIEVEPNGFNYNVAPFPIYESNPTQEEVQQKQNGWYYGEKDNPSNCYVTVGNGNPDEGYRTASLASSTFYWGNYWLGLDLNKAAAQKIDGKIYVKCGMQFKTASPQAEFDLPQNPFHSYLRLMNGSQILASIDVSRTNLALIALNAEKDTNIRYTIADGLEEVYGKWRTLEFYIDTDAGYYSLMIDGEFIETENGIRIPFSSSGLEGAAAPANISGLDKIEMANDFSSGGAVVAIGGIKINSFEPITELKINSLTLDTPGGVIGQGVTVEPKAEITTAPEAVSDVRYEYSADGTAWKIGDAKIPSYAKKLRVTYSCEDILGQSATTEQTFDVVSNQIPSVSDLSVSGEILAGEPLTAQYEFNDDGTVDNSRVEWFKASSATGPYTKISDAAGLTYTPDEETAKGFIRVQVTPIDEIFAEGEPMSLCLTNDDDIALNGVMEQLSIDYKDTDSQIELPSDDSGFENPFGASITWRSGNTDIIGNDGTVNRNFAGVEYVTLTAAVRVNNSSLEKAFVIKVTGSKSSGGSSGGGSGGSGSGGGSYSGAGSLSLPTRDPEVALPISTQLFSDLPADHWAYEYIAMLGERSIVSGDQGMFRPDEIVTRAEFLKMLINVLELDGNDSAVSFEDVSMDDWFYPFVSVGVEIGLINGVSETQFSPMEAVSRQDMAVMLERAMDIRGVPLNKVSYPAEFLDRDSIADYAAEAVATLHKAGILRGYQSCFHPTDSATRAEASKVVAMVLQLYEGIK
ncbi:MAG: S-layer homology domain-containing protein [Monoglobaceae bacterium]